MGKTKLYKLIALFLAVCLLMCGCAGKKQPKKNVTAAKAITMQMRFPSSFNPLKVENQSVRDVFSLCYEPLFAINENMQSEGILAESIAVSDDCMSAVITLKDSVLWHDGVKMTSADVVHTVNFLKENYTSVYSDCVKNIDTVTGIDPLSVQMTFIKPQGHIAYSLYFPIIAYHNANSDETILGTGPYMFESYAEAVSLELKRFDKWHGGQAECEKAVVTVVRDNEVATSAFNVGSINVITGYSFDSENNTPKPDSKIFRYPSLQYEFVMFNHNNRILSSPTLRSAISSAIDRTAIVSESYSGAATETNSPIHPASAVMAESSVTSQYNLSNAGETFFLEGYSFDESTGFLKNEDGERFSFKLLVNKENQSRVKAAYQLCAQLFVAGIEVVVEEVDFDKYVSRIKSGSYDAYIGGVTLSNLYDFEFFFGEESTVNGSGYVSDALNMSMDAISKSPSEGAISTALMSFDETFLREQPFCGLVFKNDMLIAADNVAGDFSPYPGMPYKNIETWKVK